jgi:distribution and morphology protein 10
MSPTRVLKVSAVSDTNLPNGGSILGLVQNDYGKFSTEYLYSTDSALLGVRGLYNFGPDPRKENIATPSSEEIPEEAYSAPLIPSAGLFSAGAELYYGLLNKSGGLSTGLRFTTLPSHTSFPYTMTLTLNPLMGNLSSTYSVKAGSHLAFSSRFDFNFYSYESGVLVGLELWRMRRPSKEVEWARKRMRQDPWDKKEDDGLASVLTESSLAAPKFTRTLRKEDDDVTGVLKARVDQNWRIGLLWEGRFKELLFSVGTSLDLKRRDQIFRGLGLEVQYSS